MVTACVGSENPAIYGTSDVWRGYVYDGTNFNSYKGMVQQGSLGNISFDQNFGGSNTSYATSGCGVQTETFSVRYRLTKNFTSGNYTFIAGGDDGYRLSFDGGATWPIDRWFDQSYATSSFTSNLNGNYNMVLEFYENGGDNRISLAMQSNLILKIDLLSFNGHKNSNEVILDWAVSGDSDPLNFIVERSADGSNFIALQTIPGSNGIRSATKQEFLCADVNPITGNSYYRLQMTDRTGKISYSNIVVIHESSTRDGEPSLYPSILAHDVLYCKSGKAIGKATLRFTDMTGRVIHQQLVGRIGKGQTIGVPLGTAGLSKGLYLVSLFDGDRLLLTEKIVK